MQTSSDARLASEEELLSRLEETKGGGILLGKFYHVEEDRAGADINYEGERHLLIFGPNGSGKGTCFLLPNLLLGLKEESVIVIDPKGELAATTANYRRSIGHDVLILNPFNVLGLGSAGFNPLSTLDPKSPTFYDDAAAIGEALIQVDEREAHWSQSAQGLVVGLLMWERQQHGAAANLHGVREMLTEADEFETKVDEEDKITRRLIAGLRVTAAKMVAFGGYEIESLAARFTKESREISGIQSAADTQTRWLLSAPMRDDLARKDGVDFAKLKDRPTTVYVILPAERLRTHSAWLRLVIVSALRSLYRSGGLRTVMLIDEMAALGHLAPLEDAFGLVRGYRVQIAAVFQDLSQLKHLYKDRWETFIANAGVVFGFGPNDLTTADWMSRRSGQTTIVAKGVSASTGASTGGQTSSSSGAGTSDSQIARPLFLPQDLFGLEEGMGLLWLAGMGNPALLFAPPYWRIKECRDRADTNPYAPEP